MPKIVVFDRHGEMRVIDGAPGGSLMVTLRDAGLPIEAACGGCCSCATCHVYVNEGWREKVGPRGDTENELLSMAAFMDESASRLACQIELSHELDGLVVTLAPED